MNNISFSRSSIDPFNNSSSASEEDEEEEPGSPASRIQKLIEEYELPCCLSLSESEQLNKDLAAFTNYSDSPRRKVRAQKINETLGTMSSQFHEPLNSPAFHQQVFPVLKDKDSKWALDIITTLKRMDLRHTIEPSRNEVMPRVINIAHIVTGDARGLHFCPPGSAARNLVQNLQINSATGVMCGWVVLQGRAPKFSTFFPDAIQTEQELIDVLENGELVSIEKNCGLYQSNTNPTFYFEMFLRERELINSAYPIFHFSSFVAGQTLLISYALGHTQQNIEITTQDLLNRSAQLGVPMKPKYKIGDRRIYDVAPLYPEKGIERGIYLDVAAGFFTLPNGN